MNLFAAPLWGYSLAEVAVTILVIAAVCAIVYFILKEMGVPIPPIVLKIVGIVLLAILGVVAIRYLVSM